MEIFIVLGQNEGPESVSCPLHWLFTDCQGIKLELLENKNAKTH